ncbi:MAG TPA: hypothetical protein VLM05_01840 [Mycobacteriales bacterium]|nr:hypothetical protein [Mycobacteriales bacterium]
MGFLKHLAATAGTLAAIVALPLLVLFGNTDVLLAGVGLAVLVGVFLLGRHGRALAADDDPAPAVDISAPVTGRREPADDGTIADLAHRVRGRV